NAVVTRFKVKPLSVHAHAAIADDATALPKIMPKLLARARVDGPRVIRNGEIKNAIDHQRRCFDLRAGIASTRRGRTSSWKWRRSLAADDCAFAGACGAENPGEREFVRVCGGDLFQRAEVTAAVIAVVLGPSVCSRLGQERRIERPLSGQHKRNYQGKHDSEQSPHSHFRVTR